MRIVGLRHLEPHNGLNVIASNLMSSFRRFPLSSLSRRSLLFYGLLQAIINSLNLTILIVCALVVAYFLSQVYKLPACCPKNSRVEELAIQTALVWPYSIKYAHFPPVQDQEVVIYRL